MKLYGKMFALDYDFNAFTLELHAIFPTLEAHRTSKKKDKTAKKALAHFRKWYNVCWDEESGKPKKFLTARKEYFKGDFDELGL